jgi:hypothetical protein
MRVGRNPRFAAGPPIHFPQRTPQASSGPQPGPRSNWPPPLAALPGLPEQPWFVTSPGVSHTRNAGPEIYTATKLTHSYNDSMLSHLDDPEVEPLLNGPVGALNNACNFGVLGMAQHRSFKNKSTSGPCKVPKWSPPYKAPN